ncbi:hypothetical protein ACNKHR_00675 [Shigella flexneri]
MRAAFLAVDNHKQVAVLVPTTLCAAALRQSPRPFANWPVRIERSPVSAAPKSRRKSLRKWRKGKSIS